MVWWQPTAAARGSQLAVAGPPSTGTADGHGGRDPGAGKILALVGSWRRRHDGTRATGAGLVQTGPPLAETCAPRSGDRSWYPRQDSNLRFRLRRPALYPTELRGPAPILAAVTTPHKASFG